MQITWDCGRQWPAEPARPVVYLDHGPMGQIAESKDAAGRLVASLRRRGTLALSSMNFIEIAQEEPGESVELLRGLLRPIGASYCILDVNPHAVLERVRVRPGSDLVAALHPALAMAVARRLGGNAPFELALNGIRAMRDATSSSITHFKPDLASSMAVGRSARQLFGIRYPREGNTALDQCLQTVMDRVFADGAEFTENDSADLLHTLVPMAVCDFVLLDKKWAARAASVPRPPRRAEVFSGKKGQIEAFLDALERWTPPPEVK